MNLKDRGITVGDLLILLVVVFSTTLVVKKLNNDKETSFNLINSETILLERN